MDIIALFTTFGWAFLSFWSAIPGGIALNLSPEITVLTAVLSYGCGAGLVVIIGEPLQKRIRRRLAKRRHAASHDQPAADSAGALLQRAWDRFGLIGLAMLSPMTVGSLGGAVIGLSLGIRPLRLVVVMTIGAGLWGVLIALAVMLGVLSAAAL
jgi:hypothetical protein